METLFSLLFFFQIQNLDPITIEHEHKSSDLPTSINNKFSPTRFSRTKKINPKKFPKVQKFYFSKNKNLMNGKKTRFKETNFVTKNFTTEAEKKEVQAWENLIKKHLKDLPEKQKKHLQKLEIRNKSHVSRGLANSKKIIINTGTIQSEKELLALFFHEFGHVLDLGYLSGSTNEQDLDLGISNFWDGKKPIYKNDPSLKFYKISWKNSHHKKENSQRKDFVSGYALSDPFEDFSEHFVFYRLHGEKFRKLAKNSPKLQKKYDFLNFYIFEGKEFQKEKPETFVDKNIWDTTLLSYDL